jgi:hypothetical protein
LARILGFEAKTLPKGFPFSTAITRGRLGVAPEEPHPTACPGEIIGGKGGTIMQESKPRYFILKHERCGGVFTINSETFLDYSEKRTEAGHGWCPSCGDKTLNIDALKNLLEAYRATQKTLGKDSYSIGEIKDPIEPEKLKLQIGF